MGEGPPTTPAREGDAACPRPFPTASPGGPCSQLGGKCQGPIGSLTISGGKRDPICPLICRSSDASCRSSCFLVALS